MSLPITIAIAPFNGYAASRSFYTFPGRIPGVSNGKSIVDELVALCNSQIGTNAPTGNTTTSPWGGNCAQAYTGYVSWCVTNALGFSPYEVTTAGVAGILAWVGAYYAGLTNAQCQQVCSAAATGVLNFYWNAPALFGQTPTGISFPPGNLATPDIGVAHSNAITAVLAITPIAGQANALSAMDAALSNLGFWLN